MRYLTPFVRRDVRRKAVLLSGPRQVGKTTLAKNLLEDNDVYLNYDIRADKRLIHSASWRKDAGMVVLDELHKYPKWKNYLKGLIDEHGNKPALLVTGSARLEIMRRGGDPLTGRTFHYRLDPIDLEESKEFSNASVEKRLERLVRTGGFPEAFLHPANAARLRNDRLDFVIREDLRDLSRTGSLRTIELLVELLRERGGGTVNYANLARDLSVSAPTVKNWIDLLERLYLIFLVYPYHRGFARSIRKEPKVYFYDCGAAYESSLENLVACSLLKFAHLQNDAYGKRLQLFFFRDRDHREVDFVIADPYGVKMCLEVKSSDDNPHGPLVYLARATKAGYAVQLVKELEKEQDTKGIQIRNLCNWLDRLSRRK